MRVDWRMWLIIVVLYLLFFYDPAHGHECHEFIRTVEGRLVNPAHIVQIVPSRIETGSRPWQIWFQLNTGHWIMYNQYSWDVARDNAMGDLLNRTKDCK